MERNVNISDKLAARRTSKVIGDPDAPVVKPFIGQDRVDDLLTAAANAPFHYACDRLHKTELTSSLPWRAYKLDSRTCNDLSQRLLAGGDTTKVPNMLAAADYLVQVTWLPDEGTILNRSAGKDEAAFCGTLRNMEHIAAASSFVQSVLLAAEGEGYMTYWSSGGALKSIEVFDHLGISHHELLIGSVFFFSREENHREIKPGALREARGALQAWSRWCQIP